MIPEESSDESAYEGVAGALAANGYFCRFNASFLGLVEGLPARGRLVVAASEVSGWGRGRSFWVYKRDRRWFIGLWSGRLFKLSQTDDPARIVLDLLSGTVIGGDLPPSDLPDDFLSRYGIVRTQEEMQ
jgi:hypothetical protein